MHIKILFLLVGFGSAGIFFLAIYFFFLYPQINLLRDTDRQTGLYNFQSLLTTLEKISNRHLIIIMDIDDFKKFNSAYGYQQGDRILLRVRDALVSSIQKYKGRAFRYRNGDEFVILLEEYNLSSQEVKDLVAEISQKLSNRDAGQHLTLSFGITSIYGKPDVGKSIAMLESALLVAKKNKNAAYSINEDFEGWIYKNDENGNL